MYLQTLSKDLQTAVIATQTPVDFAHAWLQWEPHPGQTRWMLAPHRPTSVLVTGRRWGKSEIVAVQALFRTVFTPRVRIGIVSVTLDQARLAFDVAYNLATAHPILNQYIAKAIETPFPLLRFKNGSEITVRTAAREGIYLRGHKFHEVIIDEADYLSERFINEVVRMTLADVGGRLILISTPRARRGLVYRELQRGLAGKADIYVQTGPTWENPHINHEYVRSLRERMSEAAWQREVEGCYVDDDAAVFRWEDIQAAYEGVEWPKEIETNRRYVIGWDLAKSLDWTVGFVLDATEKPFLVVHFERFQRQPWPMVTARIRSLHLEYQASKTLIDATGVGQPVLDEVHDVADGYIFTAGSKTDLINNLQVILEKRQIRFPFVRELVDELQQYEWDDKKLETDCVMALALACWAAAEPAQVEYAPSLW